MHAIFLLLLLTSATIQPLMGMEVCQNLKAMLTSCCVGQDENDNADITIVLPKDHSWSRQKYETLNASDTETFTHSSFGELIKEHHQQGKAYALARAITTKNVRWNSKKTFIHYFDAAESQKTTNNQDPINRIAIEKTDCFNINPNDPRRAIHAFTVFGALSQMNARANEERSALLINQSGQSRAENRLCGSSPCDQCTCGSLECVKSLCQCLSGCLECCREGTGFMCMCVPATIFAIGAPIIDCALLPCAPIGYCCNGDCDCFFPLSREACPNYCEQYCCCLNCRH
jgi:hypothetical protein